VSAVRLVGIARLAHQAPVLLEKRSAQYFELPAIRLLNECDSDRVPFRWTINPYRGCEFGCKYCYARYTHEFMELRDPDDFEWKIYTKRWNPADLRSDLRKVDPKEWIAIGTATDPYQPAERKYRMTRSILEILANFSGRHFSIATKSDLVARDIDVLSQIAAANWISVGMTITTVDEALARKLEPRAPRPELRLDAVRRLRAAGIHAGVMCAPAMPLINDREAQLEALAAAVADAGGEYLWANPLFLKPCASAVFFPFVEREFPQLAGKYRQAFASSAYLRGDYAKRLEERLARVRARHGLDKRLEHELPRWIGEEQMRLPFE
jgi:DNA repair photolyase